jgi:hypothetical protein
MKFTRLIDTGDRDQDTAFKNGNQIAVGWAFGNADTSGKSPLGIGYHSTHRKDELIDVLGVLEAVKSPMYYISSPEGWKAYWEFTDSTRSSIKFFVSSPVSNVNDWIGISFSPNKTHTNSDMVVGFSNSYGPQILDTFSNSKGIPLYDQVQNIRDVQCTVLNGLIEMQFVRDLDTGDNVNDLTFHNGGQNVVIGWAHGKNGRNSGKDSMYDIHDFKGQKSIDVVQTAINRKVTIPNDEHFANVNPGTAPPAVLKEFTGPNGKYKVSWESLSAGTMFSFKASA